MVENIQNLNVLKMQINTNILKNGKKNHILNIHFQDIINFMMNVLNI